MIDRLLRYFRNQLSEDDLEVINAGGKKDLRQLISFTLNEMKVEILVGNHRIELVEEGGVLDPYLLSKVDLALRFLPKQGRPHDYEVQLICNYFGAIVGYCMSFVAAGLEDHMLSTDQGYNHNCVVNMAYLIADEPYSPGGSQLKFSNGIWTWFHKKGEASLASDHDKITEEWNLGLHSKDLLLNPNLIEVRNVNLVESVNNCEGVPLSEEELKELEGISAMLAKFRPDFDDKLFAAADRLFRVGFTVLSPKDKAEPDEVWIYSDEGDTSTQMLSKVYMDESVTDATRDEFLKKAWQQSHGREERV